MSKSRLWICGIVLGTMMFMPALSRANLLLNPGFESAFDHWNASGFVSTIDPLAVHTGNAGATISLFGGTIDQSFTVSSTLSLYFSAYIRLYTPNLEGNTGLVQVTLKHSGGSSTVLGGAVDSFDASLFNSVTVGDQEWWLSDWILLEGFLDLSGISGVTSASIVISFLPDDGNGIDTSMFVDDVVVQHTPLPWAVSFFASGLLGLLVLRKKPKLR